MRDTAVFLSKFTQLHPFQYARCFGIWLRHFALLTTLSASHASHSISPRVEPHRAYLPSSSSLGLPSHSRRNNSRANPKRTFGKRSLDKLVYPAPLGGVDRKEHEVLLLGGVAVEACGVHAPLRDVAQPCQVPVHQRGHTHS